MFLCTNTFAVTLTKGVPVAGLSATAGGLVSYDIVVPSGATNLVISASGGSGDADLSNSSFSATDPSVVTSGGSGDVDLYVRLVKHQ